MHFSQLYNYKKRFQVPTRSILVACLLGIVQGGYAGPNPYWNSATSGTVVGGSGSWDNATTNWASDPSGTTYAAWDGDVAIFSASSGNVTPTANLVFNQLQFTTTGYTIAASGNTFTPNASSTIQTDPGVTATIKAKMTATASAFKTGSGTLNVSGTGNTFGDTFALDGGTTNVDGTITSALNTYVGNNSTDNLMTVTGSITNTSGSIGVAAGANKNTATVTGGSAFWTSLGDLDVGYQGNTCTLNVNNAAQVNAANCKIGVISGATGNVINVDGTNSVLNITSNLIVGVDDNNNKLNLTNGGHATSTVETYVGLNSSAGNNTISVANANSLLTVGGVFYIGFDGGGNNVTISNQGKAAVLDTAVGYNIGASGNSLVVTGNGSEFDVTGGSNLYIGHSGTNNSMTISNGGKVDVNKRGRIGFATTASGNIVTVTDQNSLWNVDETLHVGTDGDSNTLNVKNGALVTAGGNIIIGFGGNANGNKIEVDGSGSSLSTTAALLVGLNGTGSVLNVINTGNVTANTGSAVASNSGSGTVNIGTGGTPGAISAPQITGGAGTANLVFNHNQTNYTFAVPITGTMNVQHIGSGTTSLMGTNTYTGSTTTIQGTLMGGGTNVFSPSSAVTIGNGSALNLGGFNQITGLINNNGLLDFGGSVAGTNLTVVGTYTQGLTGTYRSKLNSAGQTDFMLTTLAATLNGTLQIAPTDGYIFGSQYHLIHADGGRNNQFVTIDSGSPFVKAIPIYLSNDVYLSFETNLLAGALTDNEKHVAEQIDATTTLTEDAQFVVNALVALPTKQMPAALNALAGEQYTFLIQMDRYGNERLNRAIYNALRTTLVPRWCCCSCDPVQTWFQFSEGNSYAHRDINSDGLKGTNWDFTLGAFMPIYGNFILGVAANYQYDHAKFYQGGHVNWNTGHASLHGAYLNDLGYIFVDGIFGRSWGHFDRTIDFGIIHRTAKSKPNTTQGLIDVEIGMNYYLCDVLFQPFIAGEFGFYSQDKIRECGADSINLFIKNRTFNTCDSYLGVHATTTWDCLMVNADLAWQHSYNSLTNNVINQFQDFGVSDFSVDGVRLGNDAVQAALNVSKVLPGCFTIYGEVSGEYWKNWAAYTLSVGFSTEW